MHTLIHSSIGRSIIKLDSKRSKSFIIFRAYFRFDNRPANILFYLTNSWVGFNLANYRKGVLRWQHFYNEICSFFSFCFYFQTHFVLPDTLNIRWWFICLVCVSLTKLMRFLFFILNSSCICLCYTKFFYVFPRDIISDIVSMP